jgi:hypothetical protein
VAERLQALADAAAYKVSLVPRPLDALRREWAAGRYELALHGVLLPPRAAPALAVALAITGRRDLLEAELPRLGAIADGAARDLAAVARAAELTPAAHAVPLFVQGLSYTISPSLRGAALDPHGILRFDDAHLTE